ncbi:MAG: O-acetyl-ADP-ribose deacetylase [Candidatus Latescibacteria bacterium]|nr:O-acetyl-ADP-ribose deacetylase [Candidatus Latescibacterota bacterium]NIM22281.1 O-acetyl-ADP-ribose deacetylase [Candidatus Latescibacterota bacterium]NIM65760.1 O-acetyl-ADP-ribose deacetylase [Candidatus Latescibacterota bacterium]NIO02145.1 O-acetyl-ADP-ribose deacetylase [Candidatus Latescibacterota bacterium]NIO28977.1 O-acetyl-ADP-ribose deacetylase [Candidatus Latescibacterota bacterium]
MYVQRKIGHATLTLTQGDITKESVDAIVNAANSSLMGGGGVDGAIHRAGGPKILEDCKRIVSKIGSLPTGEAVITTGGNLKACKVIHTVGPIWYGGNQNEPALLENAYRNSLALAKEEGIRTVAFPSISTGAYRFPIEKASDVALSTVIEFLREHPLDEVRFVLFSPKDFETYNKVLNRILPSPE